MVAIPAHVFRYEPGQPKPVMPIPANDNAPSIQPLDPWQQKKHPALPSGLLPAAIEDFARAQGELMGVDAGGLAAASLAVCAAAIDDGIRLKVKRHDEWTESARLWVALIGNPSTKKSPIISAAARPIQAIDDDLVRQYIAARTDYEMLEPAAKKVAIPPSQIRARLEDVTVEAAQEVFRDTRGGVLLIRDELSGWFGSTEKYSSGKGASADKAFWLQAFNGGSYSVNRVGRGVIAIDNLSVSLLGGIQPEMIREIAASSADDGLLQRLFPIVLGPSGVGQDAPMPPVVSNYRALVSRLHQMGRPLSGMIEVPLTFDDGAQRVRQELAEKHHAMTAAWEVINKKLAAHVGKYDGLFARLCIVWHCIEFTGRRPISLVSEDTARRVARFLHEFLFPHAVSFYTAVLGASDKHDALLATAGYILAHGLDEVAVRDIKRGDSLMRELKDDQAEEVLRHLDAMAWLDPIQPVRNQTALRWKVRPDFHDLFAKRATAESERRERVRKLIAASMS